MLILAFETSAKAASVALMENGKLLAQSYQNTGLTHSQTLLPMAQDLLKNCGRTPQQVEAVAVAAGPGSFTGIRIGVAAAKGLAWGKELPCYGVSTLEAMALNMGVYDGLIVPVMDARRNQVYTATFLTKEGTVSRLCEDRAISLEELGNELKNVTQNIFLVGDGSNVCYNALQETVSKLILPPEHRMHQQAAGVALAAQKQIDAQLPGDGAQLNPNYLRLSQAERERQEKESREKENKQ